MSTIYSALGIADGDRSFIDTVGQRAVFDAVQQVLEQHNRDIEAAQSVFVERTTEEFKFRYYLPASGYLQRRGVRARPAAAKVTGNWDVAFPLEDFGDEVAGNDVDLAYMRLDQLQRHIEGVQIRDKNTVRREILVALFAATTFSFVDQQDKGTLAVEPLANGDAVLYPPILGSDSEETEDHIYHTGYTVANISNTNDPCVTVVNDLEEHFGARQGGSNIVMFVGSALGLKIASTLTDFDPINDRFIIPGSASDTVVNLPTNLPGKVLGRHSKGCWVVEWRFIPDDYALALDLDAPRPLIQRIDEQATGLGTGLQLIDERDDKPFRESFWRHRFGYGVGNRLNGVALKFDAAAYSVPTAYAR
jgi:hypothetical protein